jgi:hypothetical protein
VTILFIGISNVELSDLLAHNTIDKISITGDRSPFLATITACIGLAGSFLCTAAKVTEFKPNYAIKVTAE